MNIVHLNTLDYGGAGLAALRLHQGLQGLGVQTTMLVFDRTSDTPGVELVPSRRPPAQGSPWAATWKRWLDMLRRYPNRPKDLEIFSGIRSDAALLDHPALQQADVVNLHWIAGFVDIPELGRLCSGKRVVWTLHDQNPCTGGCHYAGDCRRFETSCRACPQLGSDRDDDLSSRQFEAKRAAYADMAPHLATPSRWLAQEVQTSALLGRFPATPIPNGVPVDVFTPQPMASLRDALGLSPDDFVLLFGAHGYTARKGLNFLQALLLRLPQVLAGRRLVAVCCGALGHELPSNVPLINLGYVADPRAMAGLYGLADLFVMPSTMDNLPNTMLESLACGTPVAAFRVGGVPEGVEHEVNGFLAEPGDLDGLIEAVTWAAREGQARRQRIAAKAREKFALDVQARNYLELYRRL